MLSPGDAKAYIELGAGHERGRWGIVGHKGRASRAALFKWLKLFYLRSFAKVIIDAQASLGELGFQFQW